MSCTFFSGFGCGAGRGGGFGMGSQSPNTGPGARFDAAGGAGARGAEDFAPSADVEDAGFTGSADEETDTIGCGGMESTGGFIAVGAADAGGFDDGKTSAACAFELSAPPEGHIITSISTAATTTALPAPTSIISRFPAF